MQQIELKTSPVPAPNTSPESAWPPMPWLPVAWGEVFDKLTILEIKLDRLTDAGQRENVQREYAAIEQVVGDRQRLPNALWPLVAQLKALNAELWDVEEAKRACESAQAFDQDFIQLARQVYLKNDQRAAFKRQINTLLGSHLTEEKSHLGAHDSSNGGRRAG